MKKLKTILGAFIVGEIATLFYKDKKFKEDFNKNEGFEKIKILFNGLVDLNKKLFNDIKSFNYSEKYNEYREYVDAELIKWEEKFTEVKNKADKFNKDKIQPMKEEFEERYLKVKDNAEDRYEDVNEKLQVEEKLDQVKDFVDDVVKKVKTKTITKTKKTTTNKKK